jgi:hypothetical protein
MNIPIEKMSRGELAAFVQSHLRSKGIQVVLSGGACVSIYSNDMYVTRDLDLVNIYNVKRSKIRSAMQDIDFFEEGRYYKHPKAKHLVELPPGPLSIGEEAIRDVNEIEFSTGTLRLITPLDCVKDRLAAYYYWGDKQCLVQAQWIVEKHDIDLTEIRRWSEVEGKLELFNQIINILSKHTD